MFEDLLVKISKGLDAADIPYYDYWGTGGFGLWHTPFNRGY
jgi:hypothetical protein